MPISNLAVDPRRCSHASYRMYTATLYQRQITLGLIALIIGLPMNPFRTPSSTVFHFTGTASPGDAFGDTRTPPAGLPLQTSLVLRVRSYSSLPFSSFRIFMNRRYDIIKLPPTRLESAEAGPGWGLEGSRPEAVRRTAVRSGREGEHGIEAPEPGHKRIVDFQIATITCHSGHILNVTSSRVDLQIS